jgi:hypothetical protein
MDAASGIDNITKQEYVNNLHVNLDNLVERLHKMAYQPQPVLRVYIPKAGNNKMRPLGIPVLEDKLVQAASTYQSGLPSFGVVFLLFLFLFLLLFLGNGAGLRCPAQVGKVYQPSTPFMSGKWWAIPL